MFHLRAIGLIGMRLLTSVSRRLEALEVDRAKPVPRHTITSPPLTLSAWPPDASSTVRSTSKGRFH
jgi:hypothetical protein